MSDDHRPILGGAGSCEQLLATELSWRGERRHNTARGRQAAYHSISSLHNWRDMMSQTPHIYIYIYVQGGFAGGLNGPDLMPSVESALYIGGEFVWHEDRQIL